MGGANWITHETGIYEAADGRNREKPFLWRQTIKGIKYSESFDTLKKAKAAKASKLAEVAKYGSIALEFKPEDWRELSAARERLKPFGVSVSEAVDEYVARRGRKSGTVSTLIEEYVNAQKARGVGKRQIENIEQHLRALSAELGESEPASISRGDVMELLNAMNEDGKSPRTISNRRDSWHAFFQHLVDEDAIAEAPTAKIQQRHLPKQRPSRKNPLEIDDVLRIMHFMESQRPQWIGWMALQLFLGVRSAEAYRFQWDWLDCENRRIVIPGWWFDPKAKAMKQGSKTEDNWMIDSAPDNFWAWAEKYGQKKGKVEAPEWSNFRDRLIRLGIVKTWPHNCRRDSFCTYHMSAFRNPSATALILKHRGTDMLWQSYMGVLRPEVVGRAYFSIYPGFSPWR